MLRYIILYLTFLSVRLFFISLLFSKERIYFLPYSLISFKEDRFYFLTWRHCGPSEGQRWARESPFGRTYTCTDATAWRSDCRRTPTAPVAATVAAGAESVAESAAGAAAATAAARRPAGSEARCPVPIWSPGPRWCRSPRSRRARTRTVAARRPGRLPDPAASAPACPETPRPPRPAAAAACRAAPPSPRYRRNRYRHHLPAQPRSRSCSSRAG